MASNLVFALVLMIETGINPIHPRAASTTIYMSPPMYATSEECQKEALRMNKHPGAWFNGDPNSSFKGVRGPLVGAWCTIPPVRKK